LSTLVSCVIQPQISGPPPERRAKGDADGMVRPKSRWENKIEMGLREIGWGGMDWIDLTQNRD
jgi:hypothetical protein